MPNRPFHYLFQHQYEYCAPGAGEDHGTWLPDLDTIRHEPGVNGVSVDRRGNVSTAGLLAGQLAKGSQPILPGDARLGRFRNYVGEYPIQGGGTFFCAINVGMSLLQNGRVCRPTPDKQWNHAFRQHLVDAGIVPAMPHEYLGEQVHRLEARLREYQRRHDSGGFSPEALERKSAEIRAEIDAMTAAWEHQFAEVDALVGGAVGRTPVTPTQSPTANALTAPKSAPAKRPRKRGA
jgi:hypothetical protein